MVVVGAGGGFSCLSVCRWVVVLVFAAVAAVLWVVPWLLAAAFGFVVGGCPRVFSFLCLSIHLHGRGMPLCTPTADPCRKGDTQKSDNFTHRFETTILGQLLSLLLLLSGGSRL